MEDTMLIIDAIKQITNDPWTMLFALIYVLGYSLKNYTSFNNKLISSVQLCAGGALGVVLFGANLAALTTGVLIAFAIVGSHSWFKDNFPKRG